MKIGISVFTSLFIVMGACQAANNGALLEPEKPSRFSLSNMFRGAVSTLFPPLHAEEMQPENSVPRYAATQIIEYIQRPSFTEQVYFVDHLVIKGGLLTKIRNHDASVIAQVQTQIALINKNVKKSKGLIVGYVLNYYPEDNQVACSGLAGE